VSSRKGPRRGETPAEIQNSGAWWNAPSIAPNQISTQAISVSHPLKRIRAHAWRRDELSHYPEPVEVDAGFFRVELLGGARRVHDGACGWGRIVDAAAAAGHHATGSDIVDRADGRFPVQDFFDIRETYDAVVSASRPFSRITRRTRRALVRTPAKRNRAHNLR
jgi:hypothetical protein